MNKTISRIAGVASIAVFVGLLTFILYTQVQSEPGDVEEQYPPATHPLVGFGPEDLPKTPITDAQIQMVDLIERVSVDCSGDPPQLRVQTKEEIPRNATIRIKTMGPAWTDALGSVRHSIIGTAEEFTVEGGSRDQSVALSSPLRSNLDGEAESLSVTIKFTDADGSLFQSLIERIAEADLTC